MHVAPLSRFLFGIAVLPCFLIASPVFADGESRGVITLNRVGTGNLLIRTDSPGNYVAAPVVAADVSITIAGTMARTVVTQRFENPSDSWIEESKVVDAHEHGLDFAAEGTRVALVTCWPFDAVVPGGAQRYVVIARSQERPRSGQ